MTTNLAERRIILDELSLLTIDQVVRLWRSTARDTSVNSQFRAIIREAFPEVIAPFAAEAGYLASGWYNDSAPELPFKATPSDVPASAGLLGSADWALGANGDSGLSRLAGVAQRAVVNTARRTIISNASQETGSRWARVAQPGACAFCAMLATRSENMLYTSEQAAMTVGHSAAQLNRTASGERVRRGRTGRIRGTRKPGQEYHDFCRCQASEVRPGASFEVPSHTERFTEAYERAAKRASGTENILAEMRAILGSH